MRKIEVVVIEAGTDYLEKRESFQMELPDDENQAIDNAIKAVETKGYNVLRNNEGGCTEFASITDGKDYIAVTVVPSAE